MNLEQIISAIREQFYQNLERKATWGRTEVKAEFEAAIIKVLSQELAKVVVTH